MDASGGFFQKHKEGSKQKGRVKDTTVHLDPCAFREYLNQIGSGGVSNSRFSVFEKLNQLVLTISLACQ
jgi:hypothetical protein